jgi:tripartite-type tricarboxylate transporter receptor subunit TctC
MASIEAGELVGLALLDTERSTVPALADVPTAVEQGYDAVLRNLPRLVHAGEVDPEVKETLEGIFKQVTEHPDFKENYADRYGMRVAYMNSEEFSEIHRRSRRRVPGTAHQGRRDSIVERSRAR